MNLIRSNLQYLRKYVKGVADPININLSDYLNQYLLTWGMYGSYPINVYSSNVVLGTSEERMPGHIPHAWRDDL